jgi:hypothetical protein
MYQGLTRFEPMIAVGGTGKSAHWQTPSRQALKRRAAFTDWNARSSGNEPV